MKFWTTGNEKGQSIRKSVTIRRQLAAAVFGNDFGHLKSCSSAGCRLSGVVGGGRVHGGFAGQLLSDLHTTAL